MIRRRARRNAPQDDLRLAREELDDAIYFKKPRAVVAQLQAHVARLEGRAAAPPPPEGPIQRRERLEQEAFRHAQAIEQLNAQAAGLARQIETLERDLHESIRMRDPAREIERLRAEIAASRADHTSLLIDLDVAQRNLAAMVERARAELGPHGHGPTAASAAATQDRAAQLRQAQIRLASLRSELGDPRTQRDQRLWEQLQREAREAEEEIATLTARVKQNPYRVLRNSDDALRRLEREAEQSPDDMALQERLEHELTRRDPDGAMTVERWRSKLLQDLEAFSITLHMPGPNWRLLERLNSVMADFADLSVDSVQRRFSDTRRDFEVHLWSTNHLMSEVGLHGVARAIANASRPQIRRYMAARDAALAYEIQADERARATPAQRRGRRRPRSNPPWSPEELERMERELEAEGVSRGHAQTILRGEIAPPPTSQPWWGPAKPFGVTRPLRQIEQGEGRMSPTMRQSWPGQVTPTFRPTGESIRHSSHPTDGLDQADPLQTNPRRPVRRNMDARLRDLERAFMTTPEDRATEIAWLSGLLRAGLASRVQKRRLKQLVPPPKRAFATFKRFVSFDALYAVAAHKRRDSKGVLVTPDMNSECWDWVLQSHDWQDDYLSTFEEENEIKLTEEQHEAARQALDERLHDACLDAIKVDLLRVARDVVRLVNDAADYGSSSPGAPAPEKAVEAMDAGVDADGEPGVWFTLNRNFGKACRAARHDPGRSVTGEDVLHAATGWAYRTSERLQFGRNTEDPMQHLQYLQLDKDLMSAVKEAGRLVPRTPDDEDDE